MDPSFSNFCLDLGDSREYPNTQYYDNTQFYSNSSEVPVTENFQTSQNSEKQPRSVKWEAAEDVALMSSWCIASENKIRGKNQRSTGLWAHVKKLYDQAQEENPEKIGKRSVEQMKGRYKRLNENVQKWIGAYREAYRRIRSGMNQKYVESDAHKIYEKETKAKFNESIVFNEVMCKHPKWDLQLHRDTTRSRPECEVEVDTSDGSAKRSRTTDEGDYSNPETPSSDGSTIQRPTGRDAAKRKRKEKASDAVVDKLQELKIFKKEENELFKRKLDIEDAKERRKEERKKKKMEQMHLYALLNKEYLSPKEEDIKNKLMMKYYGD